MVQCFRLASASVCHPRAAGGRQLRSGGPLRWILCVMDHAQNDDLVGRSDREEYRVRKVSCDRAADIAVKRWILSGRSAIRRTRSRTLSRKRLASSDEISRYVSRACSMSRSAAGRMTTLLLTRVRIAPDQNHPMPGSGWGPDDDLRALARAPVAVPPKSGAVPNHGKCCSRWRRRARAFPERTDSDTRATPSFEESSRSRSKR